MGTSGDGQGREQANYYADTAATYDEAHVAPGDEHFIALEYVRGLLATVRAESILDVGAGTGRAVRFLRDSDPSLRVEGVEPSAALREQAEVAGVHGIRDGQGQALPYADNEFDAVLATAVMHHVPDPSLVVAEMCRVARKVVFISDANRYGQGRRAAGAVKLALTAARLWEPLVKARTRGKGSFYSEGDGLFYSYSVYDSTPQVAQWANRSFLIPTKGNGGGRTGPLLTAGQALLVGVREPCFDGWAGTSV